MADRALRYGLVGFPLGQLGVTVDASAHETVTTIARAADELGFDFVAAQDHVVAPRAWVGHRSATPTWYDPVVVLSWVAAVTRRVRLLTDVLVLPYRSPFAVAKTVGSLDALSGGRAILGVAPGYVEAEFRALGAPFEQRGAVTDEAIEVIKRCWTEEWVDVSGRFFSATDVTVSPRPAQQPRPPIWVGGNSLRAVRRAVEHADGWTPFKASPDAVAAALARARDWGLEEGQGFAIALPIRGGIYAGDAETLDLDSIRRQADAYEAAGVTHVKIGFRGPSLDAYVRAMESFAAGVIET